MSQSKHTEAAIRAAKHIGQVIARHYGKAPDAPLVKSIAGIIDSETGLPELVQVLDEIVAVAGDLIDERSPEAHMQARAALRRSAGEAPRED